MDYLPSYDTSPVSYILITPLRNEITTVEITLQSIIQQKVRPMLWVILDDGSQDGSADLVDGFCRQYPWIRLIGRPDRGFDLVGQGVAELLNYGMKLIREYPSSYVGKIDADLHLPADYFETLLVLMATEPSVGVCSGHPYTFENGRKFLERHGDDFPSGTARLYRRCYLEEIGDFVNSVGWDTVDLLRMQMHGYKAKVLHSLEYHHIRRMGTRNGYRHGMIRDGRNAYLTGYHPLFFLCRAVFNMRYRPYLLRTLCMLWGYCCAWQRRLPYIVTDAERTYHIKLQKKRLYRYLGGNA